MFLMIVHKPFCSQFANLCYEFYTKRGGTCEVRIDEFKNGLNADRLSCHRFLANQFRLFLHMAAYWLVLRLREALEKTEFSSMQIQQLRLRILKIGGQVIQTARRLWFSLASGYPWKNIFELALQRLLSDTCWVFSHPLHNRFANFQGIDTSKIREKYLLILISQSLEGRLPLINSHYRLYSFQYHHKTNPKLIDPKVYELSGLNCDMIKAL